MDTIGEMPMPAQFRYREVFLRGKPEHDRQDPFRIRHPKMETGRRAKLFAPFDALRGFSEAVASKDVLYREAREPGEGEAEELDRKLGILRRLTESGRSVREHPVRITVTYYVPCEDPENEAYGSRGLERTVTGVCRGVDAEIGRHIRVDDVKIPLRDLCRIEGGEEVFGAGPDEGC